VSARPRREAELAPPVVAHLEAQGYRVWVDPDGTDYFDVVARRGATVGLVELKLADGKTVLRQALRRRAWGDWVAVAVPREALARRIAAAPVAERGGRVGVWWIDGEAVRELRPARSLVGPGESDPFAATRAALADRLDLLEAGSLAPGVHWGLLTASRLQLPGGRTSRDWRLDEFAR
jgi:hypothetical protein